jgi:hypothetical protein
LDKVLWKPKVQMLEAEQKEAKLEFKERLDSANKLEIYSQLAEQVNNA